MKSKFSLSILVICVLSFSFVSAIIPYEGLTLEWKGNNLFENKGYPSVNTNTEIDWIFVYSNLKDGRITQKFLESDEEEVIDIESRELITGNEKGNKTSQWINPNVSVGDKIFILGKEYIVKGTSDRIYLKDFGSLDAIKVEFTDKLTEETHLNEKESVKDINQKLTNWYDLNTGIKLKSISSISYIHNSYNEYFGEMSSLKTETRTIELRENNVDNDKDGLTDLEELFEYQTNPLSKDSDSDGIDDQKEIEQNLDPINEDTDGDFWKDGKDSDPHSAIFPLVYYILGFLFLISGLFGFFWIKKSKKKK